MPSAKRLDYRNQHLAGHAPSTYSNELLWINHEFGVDSINFTRFFAQMAE